MLSPLRNLLLVKTILIVLIYSLSTILFAQKKEIREIGVNEEALGSVVDINNMTFFDEEGKKVNLGSLFDKPVALTLVYFRCPGICTPLLQDQAVAAGRAGVIPGKDYKMITISFDPTEKNDLAKRKQTNMIASVKGRKVDPKDWRFLTGDEENIRKISEAIGFNYKKDKNGVDYVHTGVITFFTKEGKIARYLHGSASSMRPTGGADINYPDFELAVIDAAEGRVRSFMKKIRRLCYTYKPENQAYVLQVNRIILGVTLLFVVGILMFLGIFRKKKQDRVPRYSARVNNNKDEV